MDKWVIMNRIVPMQHYPNHVLSVVVSIMICVHVPNHESVFGVEYQDTSIVNVPIVKIYPNVSFVEFVFRVVIIDVTVGDVLPMHRRTMPNALSVKAVVTLCVEK